MKNGPHAAELQEVQSEVEHWRPLTYWDNDSHGVEDLEVGRHAVPDQCHTGCPLELPQA